MSIPRTAPADSSITARAWDRFTDSGQPGQPNLFEKTPWGVVSWNRAGAPTEIVLARPDLPVRVALAGIRSTTNDAALIRSAFGFLLGFIVTRELLHLVPITLPGLPLWYSLAGAILCTVLLMRWPDLRNRNAARWISTGDAGIDDYVQVLNTISGSRELADRPQTLRLIRTTMWDAARAGLGNPASARALDALKDVAGALEEVDTARMPTPAPASAAESPTRPHRREQEIDLQHWERIRAHATELHADATDLRTTAAALTREQNR